MKIRTCAVAGMFYPGEPSHLEQLLGKFFAAAGHETSACGIVAPMRVTSIQVRWRHCLTLLFLLHLMGPLW